MRLCVFLLIAAALSPSWAGLDPDRIVDPLAITPEMEELALEVAGTGSQQDQLVRLQHYLFDQANYRFDYEALSTLTAKQAFQKKRGNCVSFTNLFIALARSLGIDAHAALAFGIPDKEMVGELILVSSHLVATVRGNRGSVGPDAYSVGRTFSRGDPSYS